MIVGAAPPITTPSVDLWGIAQSEAEHKAIRTAAETTPGVSAVNDNLVTRSVRGLMG